MACEYNNEKRRKRAINKVLANTILVVFYTYEKFNELLVHEAHLQHKQIIF